MRLVSSCVLVLHSILPPPPPRLDHHTRTLSLLLSFATHLPTGGGHIPVLRPPEFVSAFSARLLSYTIGNPSTRTLYFGLPFSLGPLCLSLHTLPPPQRVAGPSTTKGYWSGPSIDMAQLCLLFGPNLRWSMLLRAHTHMPLGDQIPWVSTTLTHVSVCHSSLNTHRWPCEAEKL